MPKEAKPDRYTVDRVGTPDPARSEYYVLDVVHDFEARVALRGLARRYRRLELNVRADELDRLLDDTESTFRAIVEARNPKQKKASKKEQQSMHA